MAPVCAVPYLTDVRGRNIVALIPNSTLTRPEGKVSWPQATHRQRWEQMIESYSVHLDSISWRISIWSFMEFKLLKNHTIPSCTASVTLISLLQPNKLPLQSEKTIAFNFAELWDRPCYKNAVPPKGLFFLSVAGWKDLYFLFFILSLSLSPSLSLYQRDRN